MVFLDIDSGKEDLIEELNQHLSKKDGVTFILFYMDGCGPCNATRPEWSKLKNVLSDHENMAVVSMNHVLANQLKGVEEPNSFPTIRFMKDGVIENYEDADIPTKDRSIDSFVNWIESKTKSVSKPTGRKKAKSKSKPRTQKGGKTKRRQHKWSRKYKRSINCRRPRGFSQRQYCKYGRKK